MKQKLFRLFLPIILAVILLLVAARHASAYDARVLKVHQFLKNQNSTLADYAADFVQQADASGLDYRWLVAISGVESTFGRNYLWGTYNAYGWGGGLILFTSWPDGITKISQALRNEYVNRGVETIDQIARIYCPPNSAHWARGVRYFVSEIENTDVSRFTVAGAPTSIIPLSI